MRAPDGMRWANGGGSRWGDCNGHHLARGTTLGTLCGRIAPHDIPDPKPGTKVCGSCARIAKVPKVA